MPFEIVRANITKMKVDAIVNSANPHVFIGAGVDSAIHAAAGPKLFEARKAIGEIYAGSAVITPAFNLKSKYVIHTVGPLWQGGYAHEIDLVKECYKNCLQLALENKCDSIAFPLISTGTYGFPKDEALQIAISAFSEFLLIHDMKVLLVVYDPTSFALSEKIFSSVSNYIDDNYIEEPQILHKNQLIRENVKVSKDEFLTPIFLDNEISKSLSIKSKRNLNDLIQKLDETFSQSLMSLIAEKGNTDVQIYKKANVDRKLFSKIRSNNNYKPSKITAISFAIALELNLDETRDLIGRAGFALSHCTKFDVIIEYFIEQKNYNVFEINEVLFAFDQSLLGL
jgi:O-acetyl-ADP-ribose deacetylase (regulator of RNase III)